MNLDLPEPFGSFNVPKGPFIVMPDGQGVAGQKLKSF
jgi:hypothetical protein